MTLRVAQEVACTIKVITLFVISQNVKAVDVINLLLAKKHHKNISMRKIDNIVFDMAVN